MRELIKFWIITLLGACLWFAPKALQAQTQTIPAGSVIIDMGITPQTVENGLKPYGLAYELINIRKVPVLWAINTTKSKDGIDFTVDGRDFRGGPFILEEQYLGDPNVQASLTTWIGKGVITYTTLTDVDVEIYREINIWPRWVLDTDNGDIAQDYLDLAEIPSSAYTQALPSGLTACDDLFILPHADPTWVDHGYLYDWNDSYANGGSEGWIWAGCHAVSVLEATQNPLDLSQRMNFLASDPSPYPDPSHLGMGGYALIDFGDHDDGSGLGYSYGNHTDSFMQFIGTLDGATENGSEQIYLPYPTGAWRPTTTVAVWDPNQADVLNGDSPGLAGKVVYGPAFGDTSRGYVMYEGGHNLDNGSEAEKVAAIRAFLNFSFDAPSTKAPILTDNTTIPSEVEGGNSILFNVDASSTTGNSFTFTWSTTCSNGSFSGTVNTATNTQTSFDTNAVTEIENCIITLQVVDACGRESFRSYGIKIIPPPTPPVANDDSYGTYNTNSITFNPLLNDTDVNDNIDPSTLSATTPLVIPGEGTFVINPDYTISFNPETGFTGTSTLGYQICDDTPAGIGGPFCDTTTISVLVHDAGCAPTEYVGSTTAYGSSVHSFSDWKNEDRALGSPDTDFSEADGNNAYIIIDLGGNALVGSQIKFRIASDDGDPYSGTLDAAVSTTGFPNNPLPVTVSAQEPAVDIINYNVTELGTRYIRVDAEEKFLLESIEYDQETCIPLPIIVANNDDFTGNPISSGSGGIAGDATLNDTSDSFPINDAAFNHAIIDNGGLTGVSIDNNGNIVVLPGSPAGQYNVEYSICETPRPNNCDTAVAIVFVAADSDNDGILDNIDLDDDNDGIPDSEELGIIINYNQPNCGGETSLDFSAAAVLEAGVDKTVGAVYRIDDVTTGTDALITVKQIFNAVLYNVDNNASDAQNFKPQTGFNLANAGDQAYVEYQIEFVSSGTTTPVVIPKLFMNFNDIDGNSNYSEENWIDNPSSYTIDNPTELTISHYGSWVLATGGTIDHSGSSNVDPEVNVSVNFNSVSSLSLRVGAVARSAGASATGRQHSIEFNCITNFLSPETYGIDNDSDGIANHIDLDSDNDGIYDAVEAGHDQSHTNGVVIAPYGSNGLADIVETSPESGTINYSITNTDGLDPPNYLDTDSDDDGCSDANEAYNDANADGGDNEFYGLGAPPVVDFNGRVSAAVYTVPADANTNSNADYIERSDPPAVNVQPSDASTCLSCDASFNVNAKTTTYQWQFFDGGSWVNLTDTGIYTGTQTATLQLTGVSSADNGNQYRVLLYNPHLVCFEVFSNTVTLTVQVNTVITNRKITFRMNN